MLKSSSLCLYSSNFGTFWLKIEQLWPFEEIIVSVGAVLYPRWPPLLKIDFFFKWPKLLYFKPESAQI
jgi:hypothetical protein